MYKSLNVLVFHFAIKNKVQSRKQHKTTTFESIVRQIDNLLFIFIAVSNAALYLLDKNKGNNKVCSLNK